MKKDLAQQAKAEELQKGLQERRLKERKDVIYKIS